MLCVMCYLCVCMCVLRKSAQIIINNSIIKIRVPIDVISIFNVRVGIVLLYDELFVTSFSRPVHPYTYHPLPTTHLPVIMKKLEEWRLFRWRWRPTRGRGPYKYCKTNRRAVSLFTPDAGRNQTATLILKLVARSLLPLYIGLSLTRSLSPCSYALSICL